MRNKDSQSKSDPFDTVKKRIKDNNIIDIHSGGSVGNTAIQETITAHNPAEQLVSILRQLSNDTGIPTDSILRQCHTKIRQGQPATQSERVKLSDFMKSETREVKFQQIKEEEIFERFGLFKGDRPGIIVAQSGIGKSTLLIQEAMLWTVGSGLLFTPSKPLRVLILETEEHKSDYYDIIPGVMKYAEIQGIELSPEQIDDRLIVHSVSGLYGEELTQFLAERIDESFDEKDPIDLIVLNPALAFMGGNASEQEAVTDFLRNQLDPLVKRAGRKVGLLIIHHTKKVTADSAKYSDNDAMYGTFGSAEWTNASRLIVTIQPYKNTIGYYEAIGAKRGSCFDWKNADGKPRQVIAHAPKTDIDGNPNYDRYWRIPSEAELEDVEHQTSKKTKAEKDAEQIANYAETCRTWFDSTTVMERPDFEERCSCDLKIKANKAEIIREIIKDLQTSGFRCEQFGKNNDGKNPFFIGKKNAIETYREQLKREKQATQKQRKK